MFYLLLFMSMFLPPEDPRLNEEATDICPCHIPSEEVQTLIDTMLEIACGESGDRSKAVLVGLAAPQIGVDKSIIIVDTAATGIFIKDIEPPPPKLEVFIDPEIVWCSESTSLWREGCFSTGCVCGIVPRSDKILVRAYDRDGNLLTQEYEGYVARIFQHEIDHLDGIRFPDRIENETDLHWVEKADVPEYRIRWREWDKRCSRGKWLEIKHGHPS
jgi:peptide deformylase